MEHPVAERASKLALVRLASTDSVEVSMSLVRLHCKVRHYEKLKLEA